MEFNELNLTELDKDLSEEQRKEWNAIYASYRAGSLLTGRVIGTDSISVDVKNDGTGRFEQKNILCLVVISYRVKILIPENEIWFDPSEHRPPHVLRSMAGAVTDYVITGIDRENECCTASRRRALQIRRRAFLRLAPKPGRRVECLVTAVGQHKMLCNCGGFDVTLDAKDVSYAMINDLREHFRTGDTKEAVVKSYDPESGTLRISVKEAQPHPFDGAEARHPLHSRRASVITGKYSGGVFCRLEDNLDCLCSYSPEQYDEDFRIGDRVIIAVTKYSYLKKLVYGKILAKW